MPTYDSKKWTGDTSSARAILNGRTAKQRAQGAVDWFRKKIRDFRRDQGKRITNEPRTREELLADKARLYATNSIGIMYFFVYDPKHKKTLPYYDKFPLVFPINFYDDGFLGINLHYLDIRNRAKLLGELIKLANNKRYDHTTKLKISYNILKSTSDLYKPCVKRYLIDHVRTKFVRVDASEWENAIFLPVESFEKAPASRVWRESRGKL